VQFKAVASLGDGCPTLDLPYAAPLNMVTNTNGLPIDASGRVVDAVSNPTGLVQFTDVNKNGDLFDDSFLVDSRLHPMPHPQATRLVDRYAVVIPLGTQGPVAVSASVYYQSVEAIVAIKFLGNMVDTNNNFVLEPCVLGGRCDGRKPSVEPAVVEGAPPVPMAVSTWVISIGGAPVDKTPPRVAVYPAPGATHVYQDAVVKAFFSKPVRGVNAETFTLMDSKGTQIPAWVDQIGDGTWALFANQILLQSGELYTATLKGGICDTAGNCTTGDKVWKFMVTPDADQGVGDTSVPAGFTLPSSGALALAQPSAP
jgi:Bacterial Ig-like domain